MSGPSDRSGESAQDVDTWLQLAAATANAGDHARALATYERVLQVAPDNLAALRGRAYAKVDLKDHAGGISDLDRVLQREPGNLFARETRAFSKLETGDPAGAEADLGHVIEGAPSARAYSNRGVARIQQKKYAEALADLTAALGIEPPAQRPNTLYNRGICHRHLGHETECTADFEEYVRLVVGDPDGWSQLAAAHQRAGRWRQAVDANSRVLELKPQAAEAYYNRGNCLRRLGEMAAAEKDLDVYVSAKPEDPDGWIWRGVARREQKKLQAAQGDLDQAIAIKGDLALAWWHRALVKRDRGDARGCRADMERAIALDPAGFKEDGRKILASLPKGKRGRLVAVVILVLAVAGGGFLWFASQKRTDDERKAFEALATTKGSAPVERFLADWPDGEHAEAARSLLDHRGYAAARETGTAAAFAGYLEKWPRGQHVEEARAAVDDEESWARTQGAEDPWPYEEYLRTQPRGRHVEAAKDAAAAARALLGEPIELGEVRRYLAEHPTGRGAARAKAILADEDDWTRAAREDTRAAAERYLKDHPEGRHVEEARGALAWLEAKEANTVEAYRAYAEANPDSPHAEEASEVVEDEETWATAVSDDYDYLYMGYRNRFPGGRHAKEVGAILEDEEAFAAAAKAGTPEALAEYIRRFPTGRRAAAARFRSEVVGDPTTLSGPIASGELPKTTGFRFDGLVLLDDWAYVSVSESPYAGVQVLKEVRIYCRVLLAPKADLEARAERLREAHRALAARQALGAEQDADAYNAALESFRQAIRALPEGLKTALVRVPGSYAPKLQERAESEARSKNLGLSGLRIPLPLLPPAGATEEDPVVAKNRELLAQVQAGLDAAAEMLRCFDEHPHHEGAFVKPDDEFRNVTGDWQSLLKEDKLVVVLGGS